MTANPTNNPNLTVKEPYSVSRSCCGYIVEIDNAQQIWVDFDQNPLHRPVAAMLGKAFSRRDLQKAMAEKRCVYLEFENRNPLKPIIQRLYHPILDDIVNNSPGQKEKKETGNDSRIIHVKGTTIILDADEIVLNAAVKISIRSGKSRIFLNALGDYVQRAKRIVSRSTKTTKIKGGVIELN